MPSAGDIHRTVSGNINHRQQWEAPDPAYAIAKAKDGKFGLATAPVVPGGYDIPPDAPADLRIPPYTVVIRKQSVKWLLACEALLPVISDVVTLEGCRAMEVAMRLLSPELDIHDFLTSWQTGSRLPRDLWAWLVASTTASCGTLGVPCGETAIMRGSLSHDWTGWRIHPCPPNAFDPSPAAPGMSYMHMLMTTLARFKVHLDRGIFRWMPVDPPGTGALPRMDDPETPSSSD